MLSILRELRSKVVLGFVGGSDLAKQQEQLNGKGRPLGLLVLSRDTSRSPVDGIELVIICV